MTLIKSILYLYIVYLIQCTHCCFEGDNITICNTLLELSMEGKSKWTNVAIWNSNEETAHLLQANSFEKVPNVKFLLITNSINGIESGAFNPLKKLAELILSNNEVTNLPPKIFNVKSLKKVWLLENEIADIPPHSFKKIEEVAIIGNSITEIKANVFSNSAIKELYLNECGIEDIEEGSFTRMSSLFILTLTRNMITSFNVKRLIGNSLSLEVLYIDFNRLTSVPRDMFDGASKLNVISLESNQIESIEDGAFSNLEHLIMLDISDNRLSQLQPQIFRAPRQPGLKALLMHDNRLTFINLGLLVRAYRLVYVSYGGNPIQCACSSGIKTYVKKQNIQQTCFDKYYFSGNFPTCIIPQEHGDMCLYDVDLTSDLYDLYKVVRMEYAQFEKNCNISNSVIRDIYGKGSKLYNLYEKTK